MWRPIIVSITGGLISTIPDWIMVGIGFFYIKVESDLPMPEATLAASYFLAIALLATYAVWIRSLIFVNRKQLHGVRVASKVAYFSGAVIFQLMMTLIVLWVGYFVYPSKTFLFEDRYVSKLKAPAPENVTGYLYADGFECGWNIYTRKKGEFVVHRFSSIARKCADKGSPRLIWNGELGQFSLVNEDGSPFGSNAKSFGEALGEAFLVH